MADVGRTREVVATTITQQRKMLSDIIFCRADYDKEQGFFHWVRVAGALSLATIGAVQIVYTLSHDMPASIAAIGVYFWWNATRIALGLAPSLAIILDHVILYFLATFIFGNLVFHKMDVNVKMPVEVSWAATTASMTSKAPVKPTTCPSQTVINNEYAAVLSKAVGTLAAADFTPVHNGQWANCNQGRELVDAKEVNWCRDTKSLAKLANAGKFTVEHLVTACYRLAQ